VSVPIFASLSDITDGSVLSGRATLFVATSALCGAAGWLTFLPLDGMGQLILFRGLQGIGAGMVHGAAVHDRRRHLFAGGARPLSGSVRRGLGDRVDLRTHARRLAHGPMVVARLLLGQSAGRAPWR
jgi:MFS family permease